MNITVQTNSRVITLVIACVLFVIAIPVLLAGAFITAIVLCAPITLTALAYASYPLMSMGVAMANRVLPDPSTLDD